ASERFETLRPWAHGNPSVRTTRNRPAEPPPQRGCKLSDSGDAPDRAWIRRNNSRRGRFRRRRAAQEPAPGALPTATLADRTGPGALPGTFFVDRTSSGALPGTFVVDRISSGALPGTFFVDRISSGALPGTFFVDR